MDIKQIVLNTFKVVIAFVGLISTFFTTVELMYFLSDPNYNRKLVFTQDIWVTTSWNLFVNMSLLSLFILQHTLLAKANVKKIMANYDFQTTYRSLYIILTAAALQVLIRNWHDIPEVTVWRFNLDFRPFWWLYSALHVLAWVLIYVGTICMDVNELLGIKQVYYSIVKLPDPNIRKSIQLQRLNSHMRHPSFLAFLLIFWSVPVMSLDRLLLAVIFTTYMYVAWNPDESDYAYQKTQYIRKFHELERLSS